MRKNGLISVHFKRKRKFVVTTNSAGTKVPAPNLLAQNFTAKSPNQKWVGDVTFIRSDEGGVYLVTVIDLFSRKVFGHAVSQRHDATLAVTAFKMTLLRRQQPKELVYHSDRGSIYTSHDFKSLLADNTIQPSMRVEVAIAMTMVCHESVEVNLYRYRVLRKR